MRKVNSYAALFLHLCMVVSIAAVSGYSETTPAASGTAYFAFPSGIYSMVSDEHAVWMSTRSSGLYRIDRSSQTIALYTPSNSQLPDDTIHRMSAGRGGVIYIGTLGGKVGKFDGTSWTPIAAVPPGDVVSLEADAQGVVWIATASKGLLKYADGQLSESGFGGAAFLIKTPGGAVWAEPRSSIYPAVCDSMAFMECTKTALIPSIPMMPICSYIGNVTDRLFDDAENCWFATHDTLVCFNNNSIAKYPDDDTAKGSRHISRLALNNKGILLMVVTVAEVPGTYKLYRFNMAEDYWRPFGTPAYQFNDTSDRIVEVGADVNGDFLLVTLKKIMKLTAGGTITEIPAGTALLPSNRITAMVEDLQGRMWIAGDQGVVRMENGRVTGYPQPGDSMSGEWVTSLALDSGGIVWAGFYQRMESAMVRCGLSCFRENRWHRVMMDHFSTFSVAAARDGTIWTAEQTGVYRYTGSTRELLLKAGAGGPLNGGKGDTVNVAAIDASGTPWAGTNHGILHCRNDQWTADSAFSRLSKASSAADSGAGNRVQAISPAPDGTVWIGTAAGLVKRTGAGYERVDAADGVLPDQSVLCIAAASSGVAWVGTAGGLVKIDGASHTTFTVDNSPLLDNRITAIAVSCSGDVWAGTACGGIAVFDRAATAVEAAASQKPVSQVPAVSAVRLQVAGGRIKFIVAPGAGALRSCTVLSLDGKVLQTMTLEKEGLLVRSGAGERGRCIPRGVYIAAVSFENGIRTCIPLAVY